MSMPETSLAPTDSMKTIPLSSHQEFLCMFDRGGDVGPFGSRYHIVGGWRVSGPLDIGTLQGALDDVVLRHEALRTEIVRGETDRQQKVHPPSSPELAVRYLVGGDPAARDQQAEELINEVDSDTISIRTLPLVRAVLGRFDDNDSVLILLAHHTAVDAWSLQVIIRDLAICYAARRGLPAPSFPAMGQYQEFARWEAERSATPAAGRSRDYWRDKLRGAQIHATRTHHPRSENLPKATAAHRFSFDSDLAAATMELGNTLRSSPFMVLLAAYNVFLHRMSGAVDIVVPTFSLGRSQARFQHTVGAFINFLPLRTNLADCRTFRDVIDRTRTSCFEAYSREIPFTEIMAEAPELMAPLASDDLAVIAFQVAKAPFTTEDAFGDLNFTRIWRRTLSQPVSSDIPDGALWTLHIDDSGEMVASLGFNSNLFDEPEMAQLSVEFRQLLRELVTTPDADLQKI